MMTRVLLLLSILLHCLAATGCSSRLISSSLSAEGPAPIANRPVPSAVSYTIIPASADKDAENALRDALSARGLSMKPADSPASDRLHLVVYLLQPEPTPFARAMTAPAALLEFASLGLMPVCMTQTYPVEIHVLAQRVGSGNGSTASLRARYTVDNCMWLPTIVKSAREMRELRYLALRRIFDQALDKLAH